MKNIAKLVFSLLDLYKYFRMFYCQICIFVAGFVFPLSDLYICCLIVLDAFIFLFLKSYQYFLSCIARFAFILPALYKYVFICITSFGFVLPALDLYCQILFPCLEINIFQINTCLVAITD